MSKGRILVVEDELIVAKDIQLTLQGFGYDVPEIVSSGAEAVQAAYRLNPKLIMMDIMIKGTMDGVDAAEIIRSQFNIPVIYLTAYSDDETLRRAKLTESYGFIAKPFDERELYVAVEFAIYKHQLTTKLAEHRQWLELVFRNTPMPVVACDREDKIVLVNDRAQAELGWLENEIKGKTIREVIEFSPEDSGARGQETFRMRNKLGEIKEGSFRQNIVRDEKGLPIGRVIVFN